MTYLDRKLVVQAFKEHVKRMPTMAEMLRYSGQETPGKEVYENRYDLAASVVNLSEDFLIYFDLPCLDREIKICEQVKIFMSKLPTFQDVVAKYATRNNSTGTDKTTSHAYGPLYDKIFEPYRNTAKNVCELGIYSGASIVTFSEYFTNAIIDGIDITLDNVIFGKENPRIRYFLMDATNPDFEVLGNKYDVILDDASHLPEHQVQSLKVFLPYLNDGGMFVIEDIAGQHEAFLKEQFGQIAKDNELTFEWYDLRSVNKQFDDIVAVFYKNKYVQLDKLSISTFPCQFG
jgi:hypothetical protein